MKRSGLSAAITALAAVAFLVLGLYMSILILHRTGGGGGAQMAGIHEVVGRERPGGSLRIFIEPTASNGTLITLINGWVETFEIDFIVVLDKTGAVRRTLNATQIPASISYIPPGVKVSVKPSELGLSTAYDGDYWRMKREISQIMVHTRDGNVFASVYGRPPERIPPIYVETTWSYTTMTTIATTTTMTTVLYTTTTTTTLTI